MAARTTPVKSAATPRGKSAGRSSGTSTSDGVAKASAGRVPAQKIVPVKGASKAPVGKPTKAAAKPAAKKVASATKAAPAATVTPARKATPRQGSDAGTHNKVVAAKTAPAKVVPKKTTPSKVAPVTKSAVTKTPARTVPKTVAPAKPAKVVPGKKPAGVKPSTAEPPAGRSRSAKTLPPKLVVREDESPWTKTELAHVRTELDAEVQRLRSQIADSEEGIADLLRDSGDGAGDDQADAGTKTFEREHEMSLANHARELLAQTHRALSRLDDGTYGVCESCGKPVGKLRLQAFPRATLCVSCKQLEERR